MKSTLIVALLALLCSGTLLAQEEIGKIFTAKEADSLYGKVMESYKMSTDSLMVLIKETKDKVMFRLADKKAIIAGDNRSVLYPKGSRIPSTEVLRVYSKSKVLELIALGRKDIVELQQRVSTFTVTNGNFTLEVSWPCPPYCEE